MIPMMATLLQSVDKVSEIDKKILSNDKKESENTFIDNMRSMLTSLSQSIDKVSEIDKKISQVDIIELIEKFPNTYRLCNKDLNKFALPLRKGVYPYEYMNSCERFNEESLPLKKYFYDELNKKDISEEDYAHALKVWEVFKIKNLGEYHMYMFRPTHYYLQMYLKTLGICV